MPKTSVYKDTGEKSGSVDLPAEVFAVEPKQDLLHQAVQTQLAQRRTSTAHTKTRSERRGGGAKPWRQKGTGRARAGSRRSPIWKGGGVIFGPRQNRNFSKRMNAKAKRQALLMALTSKFQDKQLVVVDKFTVGKPKTRELEKRLDKLPTGNKTTLITISGDKLDNVVKLSARNIPGVGVIRADSLNVKDLLTFEYLLLPKASLDVITRTYLSGKSRRVKTAVKKSVSAKKIKKKTAQGKTIAKTKKK